MVPGDEGGRRPIDMIAQKQKKQLLQKDSERRQFWQGPYKSEGQIL